jgi:hypothetical protein
VGIVFASTDTALASVGNTLASVVFASEGAVFASGATDASLRSPEASSRTGGVEHAASAQRRIENVREDRAVTLGIVRELTDSERDARPDAQVWHRSVP